MSRLPVIIGFGGISPAGRSSGHQGYRRLVLDRLAEEDALQTRASLASLMGLLKHEEGRWLDNGGHTVDLKAYLQQISPLIEAGTLIRKLESNLFDPEQLLFHRRTTLSSPGDDAMCFHIRRQHLPDQIPENWQITEVDHGPHAGQLRIEIQGGFDVLTRNYRRSPVNAAGQLPSGFDPQILYASRNHPRGLQLTIYGASDAIQPNSSQRSSFRSHRSARWCLIATSITSSLKPSKSHFVRRISCQALISPMTRCCKVGCFRISTRSCHV